jgi:S-DNA-T family DNA segregation ATPase FtsK/SpoIIIE
VGGLPASPETGRLSQAARKAPEPSALTLTPGRIAGLLRESWWLGLVAAVIYLAMVLYTFDRADPGWSHSTQVSDIRNAGGAVGAWVSDLLLWLFGISAWWWLAFCLYLIWWVYRRLDELFKLERAHLAVAVVGFLLLLVGSCSLEALRLYSHTAALPLAPGGMVGLVFSGAVSSALGFTGSTLMFLVMMTVGFSLFANLSLMALVESTGAAVEHGFEWALAKWYERQDRKIGAQAAVEREEVVEVERKRFEHHEPIRIEPPKVEIVPSVRVEKEKIKAKQTQLFADLPDSPLPPLDLLDEAEAQVEVVGNDTLEFTSRLIEKKLADFGVEVKVVAAYPGPVITRYEVEPATGVKGSQVVSLMRDLARALSVASIRVIETIPGKTCMGLEIPNPRRQMVRLSEILSSQVYADNPSSLTVALGKDIGGKPMVADLAKMPHLLVAGTTGSGKSVGINAMILSLVYKSTADEVRMIMIDPKMLELSIYEGIPHLLAPVVTDMTKAAVALNWCVAEMDRRYKLMSALGVRNVAGLNAKIREAEKAGTPLVDPIEAAAAKEAEAAMISSRLGSGEDPESIRSTVPPPDPLLPLPLIVVVIDELADLMMVVGKKVEELIARLAQKARAAGVHLILATQRPSVDVITGLIKANIPTRIAFQVSSKIDSRTILDQMGAEALLGQGDMLYLPPGTGYPLRVHGAFVSDDEVHRVVDYLKKLGAPQYDPAVLAGDSLEEGGAAGEGAAASADAETDALYDEAVAIVLKTRRPSISLVQRHLRIGYNRSARLIEQMERAGLVSSMQTNGNREVLVPAAGGER